jgi:hypothetical protein
MYWRCLILFIVNLVSIHSNAQSWHSSYFSSTPLIVEVSGGGAIPTGAFSRVVPKTGSNLSFYLACKPTQSPLEFGISLRGILYGYEQNDRQYIVSVPSYQLVLDKMHYMIPLNLHLRFAPEFGDFQPYIELFGGLKYIATRTSTKGTQMIAQPGNPDSFTSILNFSDLTNSFGLGIGLKYSLFELGNVRYQVFISGQLQKGGNARYLSLNDISVIQNEVYFNHRNSTTDLFLLNFGIGSTF